jgi:hypothetical protein
MLRRLFQSTFLILTVSRCHAEQILPEMWLERGTVAMQFALRFNEARYCFLQPVLSKNVGKRAQAEALWHIAELYRRQGNEHVSLEVLHKLGEEHPAAAPFGPAAARQVSELGDEISRSFDIPNNADLILLADLTNLLKSSLQKNDAATAQKIAQEMDYVFLTIEFELKLRLEAAPADEQKARHEAILDYAEFHQWASNLKAAAQEKGCPAALELWNKDIAETLMDVSQYEPEDFNNTRFANRAAFLIALGGSVEKAAAAAEAIRASLLPLTKGPVELSNTHAAAGELSGVERALLAAQAGKPSQALQAALRACLAYHSSGIAGQGLIIEDQEDLQPEIIPKVIECLMHLELAMAHILGEETIETTSKELKLGLGKLTALRDATPAAKSKKRLDRAIANVKTALDLVDEGSLGRAMGILENEAYVSR